MVMEQSKRIDGVFGGFGLYTICFRSSVICLRRSAQTTSCKRDAYLTLSIISQDC